MRSIWKGHIRLSLVEIPVRIYNAVDTTETIKFNLLHRGCGGRLAGSEEVEECPMSS